MTFLSEAIYKCFIYLSKFSQNKTQNVLNKSCGIISEILGSFLHSLFL